MPADYVARALYPGPQIRSDEDSPSLMVGRFATYDAWTEINSRAEGHFLERFAPGSMTKTITENGPAIRALFQHGMDPTVGDKPLGIVRSLDEADDGVHFEVELLDASYVADIAAGLRAGLYGSSFRFLALRADRERSPKRSEFNPQGLPEVTIREAKVREFGPVTFPAYAESTAGMRSVTDDLLAAQLGLTTHAAPPSALERRSTSTTSRIPALSNNEKRRRGYL